MGLTRKSDGCVVQPSTDDSDASDQRGGFTRVSGDAAHGGPTRPGLPSGLDRADDAFRTLNTSTARLVQLLTDELVPLATETLAEIADHVDRIRAALPHLAQWRGPTGFDEGWVLEPPFRRVAVRLSTAADLDDVENVERLRRSLDLLAPKSLALRKEAAIVVVDALLHQLRQPGRT